MGRIFPAVLSVVLVSFVPVASAFEKHINCGGGDYTALDGTVYSADSLYAPEGGWGYTNGNVSVTSQAIADTGDDSLYQTERWGVNEYKLDLPNGLYRVTFRFAENYLGAVNARVFDVWLEGRQVLTNLDIYARVGWARALNFSFVTEVRDEQLNIQARSTVDNPSFGAISVESLVAPQPQEFALKGFDVAMTGAWAVACMAGNSVDLFTARDFTNACGLLGLAVAVTDTASAAGARVVLANPLSDPQASRLCGQRGVMPDAGLGAEGYRLEVFADNLIVISATNSTGLFYGVQTLKQLLSASGGVVRVAGASIRDWPDQPWRGICLFGWPLGAPDGVNEAKLAIDLFASLKINRAEFSYDSLWWMDRDDYGLGRSNRSLFQELFAYCRERHIEPYPAMNGLSTAGNILSRDPHCAEGAAIADEPFRFSNDVAVAETPSIVALQNTGFEADVNSDGVPDGWLFYTDVYNPLNYWQRDATVAHSGGYSVRVERSTPGSSNPLIQSLNAQPSSVYRLAFYGMRAAGTVGEYHAAVRAVEYTSNSEYIVEHFIPVTSVDSWGREEMSIRTQPNCGILLVTASFWNNSGTMWVDDVELERMNGRLVNVVRTTNSNIKVTNRAKTTNYVEGVDYEVIDGYMAYPYEATHAPTQIRRLAGGGITNGQRVLVSYDTVLNFNQIWWKAPACLSEPRTWELVFDGMDDVISSLSPKYFSVMLDELYGMNRDSRCASRGMSNSVLLADAVNRLRNHIHEVSPSTRMLIWDDMISPYHNGAHDYFQVVHSGPWGETGPALNLISNDVIPLVWWDDPADNSLGKMQNSPALMKSLGLEYIVSPWYNFKNIRDWADLLRANESGLGMLDTTWEPSIRDRGVEPSADYSWCFKPSPIATASSCQSEDYQAARAIDGSAATRWASQFLESQWLCLDFIKPRAFNTVRLRWEAAYGRQYNIQISNDGASWTTVHSETNSDGGLDIVDVGVRTSRYVRILGVQRGTAGGYSLWEFEVGDYALRGYWPADESGGSALADLSGNGLAGTAFGTSRTNGRAGRALVFDGTTNSYAEIADSPDLSPRHAMSIDLCFRFDSVPHWWNRLLEKGFWSVDNRQTSYLIATGQDVPVVAFQIYFDGGDVHTVWSPALETNRWYHLVGTYAPGRLRLYVDGELVQEDTTATGLIQRVSHPLCLGSSSAHTENFQGAVDEVKIYGRELGAAEIGAADSDRDGIPDSAEGGTTPYIVGVNDQSADADSDGASNYHEFLAGSGAADSNSVFDGVCRVGAEGVVAIRWPSMAGRRYSIERATDMSVRDYLPLAQDLPATPPENVFTDTVSGVGPYYYRVKAFK